MSLEDFDEDFENGFDTIKSDNSALTFTPFIPIMISVVVIITLNIYNKAGGTYQMNTPEIIAIVVAIIGVAGALWTQVIQFKKDAQRIDTVQNTSSAVKNDTTDMKPRIKRIERESEKTYEKICESIIPAIKKIDGIDELVAHMHKEEGRSEKVSQSIETPGYLIASINGIYDKNVELNLRIRELESQNRELSKDLAQCRQEVADLKAELSKYKAKDRSRNAPSL